MEKNTLLGRLNAESEISLIWLSMDFTKNEIYIYISRDLLKGRYYKICYI